MSLPTTRWRTLIDSVVTGLVVPADVFEAMVLVESNGNPDAHSKSDARGLAQLIPRWHKDGIGTKVAAEMGRALTDQLWFDPEFSLRCGSRHLAWCFVSDDSQNWERAVRKYFSGTADPSADFVDGQGTSVGQHIQKFRDALAAVQADRAGRVTSPPANPAPNEREEPMVNHVYVFSMGHRNGGLGPHKPARGGAPGESEWTPRCTRFVAEEFRARGATVFIAQEEDGDDEPNDSAPIPRQDVAKLSASLARQHGALAYLSFHYNGSEGRMPGFHAVIADQNGETFESNAKDVRLAKAIAERLRATNTVSIHGDGTFRESSSGAVNAQDESSRLGEMAGTASVRDRTVRLILEAADFSTPRERKFLEDDDWLRKVYAVAVADGCADEFGSFPKGNTVRAVSGDVDRVGPRAEPVPVPDLTAFIASGALVKTPPPVVTIASGERMEFVNRTAKAVRATPRRQFGSQDAPSIGPDIEAGEPFVVTWKYQARDGLAYYLTPFWTRVDADDVELIA